MLYQTPMTNIDTDEGMEDAKSWIREFIAKLAPVVVWGIPRSLAAYRIDQPNQILTRMRRDYADDSTERVFLELGYTLCIAEE